MHSMLEISSFIIAVVAIIYTILESRRNNKVIVRIINVSNSYCIRENENSEKPFNHFLIILKSYGLPLHNMEAKLVFSVENYGTKSFSLSCADNIEQINEFQKGMISEYHLKSYDLDERGIAMLADLKDPFNQKAKLNLYSQGYLALSIRIGRIKDQLKSKWNKVAFGTDKIIGRIIIGKNYDISQKPDGYLPKFNPTSKHILDFIRGASQDLSHSQNNSESDL